MRNKLQLIATLISNGYILGFLKGKIYKGDYKYICVPGLNCYSCPGAIGSCPIGSLQAVLGGKNGKISFYIFGTLIFFGVLLGRFICGFLCPFGFFQDLLYKIKFKKITINKNFDHYLRYLKYLFLIFFVILMPIFLKDEFNIAAPYFCKYICPTGILEGGIPLVLTNQSLRESIGFLFFWKMFLLIMFSLLGLKI